MDVIINELDSVVEITSDEIMLDPVVLRRVVNAVMSRLRDEEAARRWEARERQPLRSPRP